MWNRRTGTSCARPVGYHRYDTAAELELLNRIWALQRLLTNHFGPQQKLLAKIRTGAKISKTYDRPATPFQRVLADTGTVAGGDNAAAAGKQAPEPGRHPTPDPGTQRRTPDLDHRETGPKTRPPSGQNQMIPRSALSGHLDMIPRAACRDRISWR